MGPPSTGGAADDQAYPGHPPAEVPAWPAIADQLVRRLFDVALTMQSASAQADGLVAAELQQALEQLDGVIRSIQTAVLRSQAMPDG